MSLESDMIQALRPVIEALDELGVEYYIGGSVASGVYGVARSTLDVDVIAGLADSHVDRFVQRLSHDYYVSENMVRHAIAKKSCFNVIYLANSYKVDVFVASSDAYDREAMQRRTTNRITGDDSFVSNVASLEDVILSKLRWFRLGNEVSERQWTDVIQMMKIQRNRPNLEYLTKWAHELKINDLLDRALVESER